MLDQTRRGNVRLSNIVIVRSRVVPEALRVDVLALEVAVTEGRHLVPWYVARVVVHLVVDCERATTFKHNTMQRE